MDNVNHPAHYETGKFECFDVMLEIYGDEYMKGFCLGNAFKYLYRCKLKHDSPIEDIKKCMWYLDRYLKLCGGTEDGIYSRAGNSVDDNDGIGIYCCDTEGQEKVEHEGTKESTKGA